MGLSTSKFRIPSVNERFMNEEESEIKIEYKEGKKGKYLHILNDFDD